jgi:anti-sigma regulatory factor (Ser/Thr protein kinase)
MARFFVSEKCEYKIGNQLFDADEITRKMTENLANYSDKIQIGMIRMALREIIINSIEHGNLDISFDEKSEALASDRYFQFINERQNLPEHRDKWVTIEYMISPAKAIYKITDQGRGFNHKKVMSLQSDDREISLIAHGRGINLVKNIFDEIKYNLRGNQVLLVKNLNIAESSHEI